MSLGMNKNLAVTKIYLWQCLNQDALCILVFFGKLGLFNFHVNLLI